MATRKAGLAVLALAMLPGGCLDSIGPHVPNEEDLQGVRAQATVAILTETPPTVRVSVDLHNKGTDPAIYHYCSITARAYREGATRHSYEETPWFGCTFGRGRRTLQPGASVRLRIQPVVELPPFRGLPRTYVVTAYLSRLYIGRWVREEIELHAGRVTVEEPGGG
ncbi:hypothetical protein [Candidatus Palauibacter sp.]|uniref:hypothetical protein n=1 Tax=Candidatus Palauibacter sp. TaxID=3101350 RepID=UPI003AF30530